MAYPGDTCAISGALLYSNIKTQYNGVNIGSADSDCARTITANVATIKRYTPTMLSRVRGQDFRCTLFPDTGQLINHLTTLLFLLDC